MIINTENINALFTGYQGAFTKGFKEAAGVYKSFSMMASSSTSEETYAWLGQIPGMREWIGMRVIKNLSVSSFSIKNATFEDTVGVPRVNIEDDQYGIFANFFEEMGRAAATKPEELVISLLKNGFSRTCYDSQFFFDTDHPVTNAEGAVTSVSNVQTGAGAAWFLLDTSRAIKPLIWQERLPFDQLVRKDRDEDDSVFFRDEYLYGVRGRGNAGYGLWQLAYASKQPLSATNYQIARASMMNMTGDSGRPLGVKPDTLVVSPNLEGDALQLLNTELGTGGASNQWANTAKLVVTPWLNAV